MYFKGKTIWITGASSGLGEALAYAFSKEGAKLILSSRSRTKLVGVQKKCLPSAQAVHVEPLDLEDLHSVKIAAQNVLERFPKIDILINNGGISQRSLVKNTGIEVDKRIMDINYLGTIALTKEVLPSMLMHKLGQIVVISSLVGKFGTPLRSSYAASKHALHGFFDSLRAETLNDNIKVTMICPGYIHTNISYNALVGDGSAQNTLDDAQANGMSPEKFSKKALHAIRKEKNEVYIGGKERFGVYIKRFFPKLLNKIVAKVKVT